MLFDNKKGQLTKTGIVLALAIFYVGLGVGLGFMNLEAEVLDTDTQTLNDEINVDRGFFSTSNSIGVFSFFPNIITNIAIIPVWINSILFLPLLIMILYLLISSLPLFGGGS